METTELYKQTLINLQKETNHPSYTLHENSDKIAVIVDPRYDEVMEGVIRNFMYFMNPQGWNLQIFSYSGYIDKIKSTFPTAIVVPIPDALIVMRDDKPNIHSEIYNKILMDIEFWKSFKEKHICIFQKDCVMYKMFPDYFSYYDFAGANYYREEDTSIYSGGINGGFSIRNRDTMIECLEKIDWQKIYDYRNEMFLKLTSKTHLLYKSFVHNEDVFFTHACEMLHKEVPDKTHRSFLSIEVDKNPETAVFHGWHYDYHPMEFALNILKKSDLLSNYIPPIPR